MVLETTQLLNNVLAKHDKCYSPVYKQTHVNHPASIWAGDSIENFNWLLNLGLELSKEYTFRYNKRHKCQDIIESFRDGPSRNKITKGDMTDFCLCMPEKYHTNDAVKSYRLYYKHEKSDIAIWTKRNIPDWWDEVI